MARRILHVIRSLDPAAGGPPVVAAALARVQARRGDRPRIAAADPDPARWAGSFGLSVDTVVAVRPPGLGETLTGRGPAGAALTALVADADVVHLHGVWDPELLAAARVARTVGRPYLVAPHGMLDPWSLRQKRWKKRLALALGWRSMLDRAAALHLLNADERDLVAALRLAARGAVIPNGIDPDEFAAPPPVDMFRRRLPALGDRPYVLFLSRLHYKKGLDYLADAFARIAPATNVDLVVAGPDGGARAEFERRIATAGLADRVHLPGPVYGTEKVAALAGAACFCLPSRQEGFSMAILEALACGTPVVVSANCHFPEVAEAGAGEVVPLDAGAAAAALGRLLADAALRARMGRAGRALVADRFTWDRVADRCDDVYATLTGSPEAVRPHVQPAR
jgi:glycosyltransferase involved in cell wall biosynthesis